MKKIYLLFFVVVIGFYACKKEAPSNPSIPTNLKALSLNNMSFASYSSLGIVVQDGRLAFADYASFSNLMNQAFADSSVNDIRAAIAGSPGGSGFVSYASV